MNSLLPIFNKNLSDYVNCSIHDLFWRGILKVNNAKYL